MRRSDLAIVGGGTAGLVAALGAAGLGARVALCERRAQTGGDCLWTGCVPRKSLLAAAELAHRMRTAASVGLAPVEPAVDFERVMAHVHDARDSIEPHDSIEGCAGRACTSFMARLASRARAGSRSTEVVCAFARP